MLYIVTKTFQDKEDGLRVYRPNGWYPRFGFKPTDERLKQLVDGGFVEGKEESKEYPFHTGGGWYELSNGESVQGKKNAIKEEKLLKK